MRLIHAPGLRPAILTALPASLAAAALNATPAPAAATAAPYRPLKFLVGHCWRGTFPDGQMTDEHCFSWIYGGKFVRDEHVVHRGGKPDAFGESIYLWDAAARQLQYLYIESAGGFSRGTVSGEGDTLVFPPTTYTEDGQSQTYRSRWQRAAQDAYDVVTEFQVKDLWVPGWTVHMKRVSD
jgi:hypothetical protein